MDEKITPIETPQDWYFSFGVEHFPHNKSYIKLYGTCEGTRTEMLRRYGRRWCMQYKCYEDVKAEKYGLSEIKACFT